MTGARSFETADGMSGIWPGAPDRWSYSTLSEVRACPRRYALRRASYPDVWDRPGYPDRLTEAAIVGTAVHEGVELVLRELSEAGCASLADEQAVAVVRRLGGYGKIAARCVDQQLVRLALNPRMAPGLDGLRARLERRTPEMRRGIQRLVSQSPVTPSGRKRSSDQRTDSAVRVSLSEGGHPEAALLAESVRFGGRVDLLIVHSDRADIVDFKTGQASESHKLQLQLYGLLWQLDEAANPRRLPVGSLVLGYVAGAQQVEPPSDWEGLSEWLQDEIDKADSLVVAPSPAATPSVDCWHCPVRQLCDEYWLSPFTTRDPESTFADAEVSVVGQNGPTSWLGRLTSDRTEVLLRGRTDEQIPPPGSDLRILDAVVGSAEDFDGLILTMTHNSEVFGPLGQ